MEMDWPMLANWIISGIIGTIFGLGAAYYSHRLARKQDDIAWQRQLAEDRRKLEREVEEQTKSRIRDLLMRDIDDPALIKSLADEYARLKKSAVGLGGSRIDDILIVRVAAKWLTERITEDH